MKLEKINNDKIKCIIGLDELKNRHIEVDSLKYGSSETRALFKDIMDRAFNEFGFDINGVPLMIEAIPLSNGEIMLIVSKVSNKEKQANMNNNMNLENHTFEKASPNQVNNTSLDKKDIKRGELSICLDKLDDVILLAKNFDLSLTEKTSLFFDKIYNKYYLYLKLNEDLEADISAIYNIISEFSSAPIKNHDLSFLNEKFTLIEEENALEKCGKF